MCSPRRTRGGGSSASGPKHHNGAADPLDHHHDLRRVEQDHGPPTTPPVRPSAGPRCPTRHAGLYGMLPGQCAGAGAGSRPVIGSTGGFNPIHTSGPLSLGECGQCVHHRRNRAVVNRPYTMKKVGRAKVVGYSRFGNADGDRGLGI